MTGGIGESHELIVPQRLRDRRRALGLTQKQVASRLSRLGIQATNKTVSCYEHGSGLGPGRLPDLAVVLECTTTYLLGLTREPRRWEPDRSQGELSLAESDGASVLASERAFLVLEHAWGGSPVPWRSSSPPA